ncbi:MAG: glycosyltransferase family 4 protein [Chloroflexi bacterium]|nr:glycosyltransferase family 4 protein [Chloroflexota bacterium]
MRLGLVIYGSLDTISGGYLYDRMLVEYLRRAGDEVEIISLPWRNYARHLTDNFSSSLIARLQNGNFDLLLQDELNHPSLFRLNRRLRGRYPLISIVHHLRSSEARPAWQNVFYRQIESRYLANVDGFIFNSRTTQGAVEDLRPDLTGLSRPVRSLVAYPAANHIHPTLTADDIRARACQPGPLRLVFVGNVIPRKGLHTLLAAVARLDGYRHQVSVAVIGSLTADTHYAQAIRRQIERDGLSDNVILRGSLGEAELASEFARSQVLVVPSSYEGFGIVYLEGMAFGLPAIATMAGAAGEIITHGENGFLIAPGDVEVLAGHIQTLMRDRERLVVMGLLALERYRAHPTWEQSAESIRNFLRQF